MAIRKKENCCAPGCCCGAPSTPAKGDKLVVFDPPMCCSTGICGPKVDSRLVNFAADLKWVADKGIAVERFNLAQSPAEFINNKVVTKELSIKGEKALPILMFNGEMIFSGTYPDRKQLADKLGVKAD